jgi:hypothetical protein
MLGLLLLFAGGDGMNLTEYQRDPIGIYDAGYNLVRKVDRKDLPKPPYPVEETSNDLIQARDKSGAAIYFRSSDVVVSGKPGYCMDAPHIAQSSSKIVAGTSLGVSSNMAGAGVKCVPRPSR